MEVTEAKEKIKEGYLKLELQLVDEHPDSLYFEFRDLRLTVTREDIECYANSYEILQKLQREPNVCSICDLQYREQVIESISRTPSILLRHQLNTPESVIQFGEVAEGNVYVEIGVASPFFINSFRFNEDFFAYSVDRFRFRRSAKEPNDFDIRSLYYSPATIKVYNMSESNLKDAISHSNLLIESVLFDYAYNTSHAFRAMDEWRFQRVPVRQKPFLYRPIYRNRNLRLPKVKYNSDIVRFYQMGVSSREPILQFLAYYQVLEYFFLRVSDQKLYAKISGRINDPSFITDSSNLDKIIHDVENHKRTTDEKEMFKIVLETFIDEGDLITLVKQYDDYLGSKKYTKKQYVFGEQVEVRPSEGHIFGNLAKRIKIVRNALVHSSDRYERNQRHIPFSETTEMVQIEIPILQYLAEKVIIGSAENLEK